MPLEIYDPEYPWQGLAAAPRLLRAAKYAYVETQAPMAMCATSALAAAAALTHPLVFACWRPGARTPGSSIFITEAESGERKSSVDRLTFREHRLFEERQNILAQEDRAKFDARMSAWTAVRKGLARAVETAVRRQDDSDAVIAKLEEHERNKPVQAQRPRILMSNATPEAFEMHLLDSFPCVNLIAKDGGDAFGAGLFDKTPMLNSLWDDGTWESRRVSRGSTVITGASICIYVQIQGPELERYTKGRAKSVHGSGNAARWFYAKPKSTQGSRTEKFRECPQDWMEDFWARARELLSQLEGTPVPLKRRPMRFSKAARDLLQWYCEKIEHELADDRRFALMRGAASKSPEMCARLAVDVAAFEGHAVVNVDVVRAAIRIGAWHLNQYRMRFCPHSEAEIDAIVLRDFFDQKVPLWLKRHEHYWWYDGPALSNLVPNRLRRNVIRLKAAIKMLEEQDRSVRLVEEANRAWYVHFDGWLPNQISDLRAPTRSAMAARFDAREQQLDENLERARRAGQRAEAESGASAPVLWPGVTLP